MSEVSHVAAAVKGRASASVDAAKPLEMQAIRSSGFSRFQPPERGNTKHGFRRLKAGLRTMASRLSLLGNAPTLPGRAERLFKISRDWQRAITMHRGDSYLF
jgi:hypothetical protein